MLKQSTTSNQDLRSADLSFLNVTIRTLAFGSCHKSLATSVEKGIIWESIAALRPDTFLWTGDAIYAPNKKGLATTDILQAEYENMMTNETIGYTKFLKQQYETNEKDDASSSISSVTALQGGVHGTWDDHDYGGNDYGLEMPDKEERKKLFLKFIEDSNDQAHSSTTDGRDRIHTDTNTNTPQNNNGHPKLQLQDREGVWNSVTFGSSPNKVKVIFLDTRSGRDLHCIPSLGSTRLPLGAPLACVTRWITAGLNLPKLFMFGRSGEKDYYNKCSDGKVLQEEQWKWLENQLRDSDAQVHVIISSIQVLTTNPVVESWGHFPKEKERLLNLLNEENQRITNSGTGIGKGLVLISGDVHQGEISHTSSSSLDNSLISGESNEGGILVEVTSSGLTHSCEEPFYGGLCAPILDSFPAHRHQKSNQDQYYTGRNFGSIELDWGDTRSQVEDLSTGVSEVPKMKVNVHDHRGNIVLTTGSHSISSYGPQMSKEEIQQIPQIIDGHLLPLVQKATVVIILIVLVYFNLQHRIRGSISKVKKKIL